MQVPRLSRLSRQSRLSRLSRRTHADDATSPAPAGASTRDLEDWEGHWPRDDSPADVGPHPQVPMMLNPSSPTLAPG